MSSTHHVVVDGSNLATEGRSVPSLAQLDEAVRSYVAEDPEAQVVVVVDASFSHRIDPSERAQLEAAELHGELVAPPAGAIGRGDAFVLRIAERTGATVLSNDSFQEFHEEHPWLFDDGRLVGGKPVPGVGWIFTPRRPVRGPRSRKAREQGDDVEQDGLSAARKAAEVAKALRKKDAKAGAPVKAVAKAAEVKHARKRAAEPSPGAAADVAAPAKAASKGRGRRAAEAAATATAEDSAARRAKAAKKADTKAGAKKAVSKTERNPSKKDLAKATATKTAKKATAAKKVAPVKAAAVAKKATVAKTAKGAKAAKQVKAAKRAPAGPTRQVGLKAAIDRATKEVLHPKGESSADGDGARSKPKRRRRSEPPAAVNAPLAFIHFIAAHPLGTTVEGVVVSFTSHGAMVDVPLAEGDVLHCYAPLTGLGVPPPRAAREVLHRGEHRSFALVALDPPRRMAELALPELMPALAGTNTRGPRAG